MRAPNPPDAAIHRLYAMMQRILAIATLVVLGGAVWIGLHLVHTRNAAERYRQQLADLNDDFAQLRETYNQAVARTAVTELLVEDGRVHVIIRTVEGEVKRIATPFKPDREIYVDYVILGNRLWIRRVFDNATPPNNAVVINPTLKDIDWDADHAQHGKAVYRRLAEGRWVITVTGDGSLGLARADEQTPFELAPPPAIQEYEPVEP